MSQATRILLPSGLSFPLEEAYSRLLRFCREEYDYYDRIPDLSPYRVEPLDVLVTLSMNSFIKDATRVRAVHRGIAGRGDSILSRIPVGANLLSFDAELREFRALIHAAVQAPGVLVPVATKVLHRKRRGFIPMLDSVVMGHYVGFLKQPELREKSQLKPIAASVAVDISRVFREDLAQARSMIEKIGTLLADQGSELSAVRILEILIWTERERNGYYQAKPQESAQPASLKNITMNTLGTIQTELVYSRTESKAPASAIVPVDSFDALEAERSRLGVKTIWWYEPTPTPANAVPPLRPFKAVGWLSARAEVSGRGTAS